ncbi:MAG: ribonuclease HI [Planctomycetes bacterium]|nr:ribonuclease HI [Planctomycetota bacterium]
MSRHRRCGGCGWSAAAAARAFALLVARARRSGYSGSVSKQPVVIYSDGACLGNPGPGGYGTVLLAGKHRKELSAGYRHTTNNRMELLGAIVGLEALKRPCRVTLWSDSQYLIHALSKGWLAGWQRKGWRTADKKAVKNQDLWQRLLRAIGEHEIDWQWVRGHSGNVENERCDRLAMAAATGGNLLEDEGFAGDD